MKVLLSVAEAAKAMGVSKNHVKKLINEADSSPKSRWRYGRRLLTSAPPMRCAAPCGSTSLQ